MAVTSRYTSHSTARDVCAGADLHGRTMIVTGGASGIGIEAVKALHAAGATVVVTARDAERGRSALDAAGLSDVELGPLDLMSLASVRRFAAQWASRPLDVLINNAGVMHVPEGFTEDGFEHHIGVNHLAHFLLAHLLVDALQKGTASRVVSLSSSAHRLAPWSEADPCLRLRDYDATRAYAESKTANALFALAFDRHHAADGIRAFSLMPGVIETPLMKHVSDADREALLMRMHHVVKTPAEGASTIVWAAIAPELDGLGGLYLENCREAEPMDLDMPGIGVAEHVRDEAAAERLWQWSLREVGAT